MKTLLLFSLLTGVLTAADLKDWKGIACVGGTDRISQIHITNLLLSHDIQSAMEGSVVYGISVPPDKAEQASQLLRADARKNGYYVSFGSNDVMGAAAAKKLIRSFPVQSVLKKSEFGSDTALGRFLRSKDISQLTTKYPYVISLSVHKRQYLSTPKAYSTGYDVVIELQQALGEADGYRGSYQVYEGGSRVGFLGASEWKRGGK
jgi:hypothetical protein